MLFATDLRDATKYLTKLINNFYTIYHRRAYLDRFLESKGDIKLISTSASPILGVPDSMTSGNEKIRKYIDKAYELGLESVNKHTH